MIQFSEYRFSVERQPLVRPFHFKGGSFSEKWINIVGLTIAGSEQFVTGIGGNAVLWSDPVVFNNWSEYGGNSIMSLIAEKAVQLAVETSLADPIDAFMAIRGKVHDFTRVITGNSNVTPTFSLNAMVALDLALWKAYALERGHKRLIDLIPENLRRAFSGNSDTLARVPLISYNVPIVEVEDLVREGHKVFKIKLGQSGSTQAMLDKDIARFTELHRVLKPEKSIHYYLDANGRYPDLETMQRFLDAADKVDALSRIVLLEEPFPYDRRISVESLPIRVAADESLHDIGDLEERINLGYNAIALKPAGKTLSLAILMAARAAELDIPCFVADSACVPMLLEWNLAFASLLPTFPGIGMGLIESNGAQNYGNWNTLLKEHPFQSRNWMEPKGGLFVLDKEFSNCSGGIFDHTGHYELLVSSTH